MKPVPTTTPADVTIRHRAGAECVTEVSVLWTPKGFMVSVQSVLEQPGDQYLEGAHTLTATLNREQRRKR